MMMEKITCAFCGAEALAPDMDESRLFPRQVQLQAVDYQDFGGGPVCPTCYEEAEEERR
jgi:hypothetical protein